MNFIRSILEHAAAGGDADQLEEEYHLLAGNNQSQDTPMQSTQAANHSDIGTQSSNRAGPNNTNLLDSIETRHKSNRQTAVAAATSAAPSNQPVIITAEQRAMIEAKRQEALKRRQQRQQQKAAPINPYAK
mmetsp:Transcript_2561/g.3244  ORF Transcript_2561/g.3244 Transcript_2561/m.3244 type:complete len:131 (-) Transcript_2561:27-419(-)